MILVTVSGKCSFYFPLWLSSIAITGFRKIKGPAFLFSQGNYDYFD